MCYRYMYMSCSGVPSVMCGGAHSTQQKVQTLYYMYYYYWVLLYSTSTGTVYLHLFLYKSRLIIINSFFFTATLKTPL